MSEWSVLCEYCKGEKFYYYYSPSDSILEGTFGAYDYHMNGTDWIPRSTKEAAKVDRFEYLQSKKMNDNQKDEWHPLKGVFEMMGLIKEAMEVKDTIKPKSEFDIIIEEQKKVFDSDLKKKIESSIELKRKFYFNMKVRLDSGGVSEYGKEIDLGRMSTCIAEIRTLEELLK